MIKQHVQIDIIYWIYKINIYIMMRQGSRSKRGRKNRQKLTIWVKPQNEKNQQDCKINSNNYINIMNSQNADSRYTPTHQRVQLKQATPDPKSARLTTQLNIINSSHRTTGMDKNSMYVDRDSTCRQRNGERQRVREMRIETEPSADMSGSANISTLLKLMNLKQHRYKNYGFCSGFAINSKLSFLNKNSHRNGNSKSGGLNNSNKPSKQTSDENTNSIGVFINPDNQNSAGIKFEHKLSRIEQQEEYIQQCKLLVNQMQCQLQQSIQEQPNDQQQSFRQVYQVQVQHNHNANNSNNSNNNLSRQSQIRKNLRMKQHKIRIRQKEKKEGGKKQQVRLGSKSKLKYRFQSNTSRYINNTNQKQQQSSVSNFNLSNLDININVSVHNSVSDSHSHQDAHSIMQAHYNEKIIAEDNYQQKQKQPKIYTQREQSKRRKLVPINKPFYLYNKNQLEAGNQNTYQTLSNNHNHNTHINMNLVNSNNVTKSKYFSCNNNGEANSRTIHNISTQINNQVVNNRKNFYSCLDKCRMATESYDQLRTKLINGNQSHSHRSSVQGTFNNVIVNSSNNYNQSTDGNTINSILQNHKNRLRSGNIIIKKGTDKFKQQEVHRQKQKEKDQKQQRQQKQEKKQGNSQKQKQGQVSKYQKLKLSLNLNLITEKTALPICNISKNKQNYTNLHKSNRIKQSTHHRYKSQGEIQFVGYNHYNSVIANSNIVNSHRSKSNRPRVMTHSNQYYSRSAKQPEQQQLQRYRELSAADFMEQDQSYVSKGLSRRFQLYKRQNNNKSCVYQSVSANKNQDNNAQADDHTVAGPDNTNNDDDGKQKNAEENKGTKIQTAGNTTQENNMEESSATKHIKKTVKLKVNSKKTESQSIIRSAHTKSLNANKHRQKYRCKLQLNNEKNNSIRQLQKYEQKLSPKTNRNQVFQLQQQQYSLNPYQNYGNTTNYSPDHSFCQYYESSVYPQTTSKQPQSIHIQFKN